MTQYFHDDAAKLATSLLADGWDETQQVGCDFMRLFERNGDLVVISIPETEVYEYVEVHMDFAAPTGFLIKHGVRV